MSHRISIWMLWLPLYPYRWHSDLLYSEVVWLTKRSLGHSLILYRSCSECKAYIWVYCFDPAISKIHYCCVFQTLSFTEYTMLRFRVMKNAERAHSINSMFSMLGDFYLPIHFWQIPCWQGGSFRVKIFRQMGHCRRFSKALPSNVNWRPCSIETPSLLLLVILHSNTYIYI